MTQNALCPAHAQYFEKVDDDPKTTSAGMDLELPPLSQMLD